MRNPKRFWLHDDGTIALKRPEPMTLEWLELVQLCELEVLIGQNKIYRKALEEICKKNTYPIEVLRVADQALKVGEMVK